MAHIPKDDVEQLWKETKDHSWKGLQSSLKHHQKTAKGIEDVLVDRMMGFARDMQKAGKPYPKSANDLYNQMNKAA